MLRRIILIALVILGSSLFGIQNESKATDRIKSASGEASSDSYKSHRQRPQYRILSTRYVSRSSFKRLVSPQNSVRIRIMQNGVDNTQIEDFSIFYDSGSEYHSGYFHGIDHSSLPLYVKVTYKAWNTFHAVQNDVVYEFILYSPGSWEVTINN
jgi:hypothetical protein